VHVDTVVTKILGENLVRAIIKDVESGAVKFIDKSEKKNDPKE
jgi:hypothetical protein